MQQKWSIPAILIFSQLAGLPAAAMGRTRSAMPAPGAWLAMEEDGSTPTAAPPPGNAARDDAGQRRAFNQLLQTLHKPAYCWYTFGLDAAASSYFASPRQGTAPMAYLVHRALGSEYWGKAYDPTLGERETFVYTASLDAWLSNELGIRRQDAAPAAVITPAVTVMAGQAIDIPRLPETSRFIREAMLRGRRLNLYLPINATALQGSGHYILAVARLEPRAAAGRNQPANPAYHLTLDYYDSLMSGRCSMFGAAEQAQFAESLVQHLGEQTSDRTIAYQARADEYHQVRSQMPGTTHCGRYATLYLFADLMGIPYSDWYQERFNRVLPAFMDALEGGSRAR